MTVNNEPTFRPICIPSDAYDVDFSARLFDGLQAPWLEDNGVRIASVKLDAARKRHRAELADLNLRLAYEMMRAGATFNPEWIEGTHADQYYKWLAEDDEDTPEAWYEFYLSEVERLGGDNNV